MAAQELPVFDWHYLPGYILLLVGLAHVVLHWNSVVLFFRQRAPHALVTSDGSRFRPGIRWMGFGCLGLIAGLAIFMAGMRFSSQKLTLTTGAGEVVSAVSTPTSQEGKPLESRRMHATPVTVTLAQLYHEGCSYPNKFNLPGLTIRTRPATILDFPGKIETALPDNKPTGGPSVVEAYQSWSANQANEASTLSLDQLSLLLFHTQGINKTLQRRDISFDLRTAPSAGALYPVNVYVVAQRVSDLVPGLYYYNPKKASLVLIIEGALNTALSALSGSPESIRSAPATIIYTSTFGRTAFKYRDRSYRYVNMDTGHAAYNLALCAASLGLRAPMVARFDDEGVNRLLALDPTFEGTLLIQPLGSGPDPKDQEPRFLLASMGSSSLTQTSFLDLIHGGTSLVIGKTVGPRFTFPELDKPLQGGESLPAPAQGTPLYPTIRYRRSVREYSDTPMQMAELSALCRAAAGTSQDDPLLSGSAPLRLYTVVRNVRGLPAGVYRYHPKEHALEQLRAGDFSQATRKACLEQEFCGTASVVFMKTVMWNTLSYPDGDRGYRYACLRAGFVGEGLYLQGTALNIGVCGVGAFEDGAVANILQLDPAKEVCLYITAAGKR